jgi:X-X-X-Leu-X-X-Gly heptad repeat protein
MASKLGKMVRGVGRAASGAAKGAGKAASGVGKAASGAGRAVGGAGKAIGKGATQAVKFSASTAKKVAKEAKKLEKPLDTATDILALVGGPAGVEVKLVKEAVKLGLKNASHPEKILQSAANGLREFVKDPGCAVWATNPAWWQVVAGLTAAKDAKVVKNRSDAMKYLQHGGTIAAKYGVPKELADSFIECAVKHVFS